MGSVEIQIEQSGAWSPGLTVSEARVLLRVGWDTLAWVVRSVGWGLRGDAMN